MIFLASMAMAGDWATLHQFAIAAWPTGVQYSFEAERREFFGGSQNFLLKNNHYSAGGLFSINPAFVRFGPEFKIEPVAFFDMTLRANTTWFYGSFTTVIPLPEPDTAATADYKHDHKDERLSAWEIRMDANARLKLKVGRLIAVGDLEARYHRLRPIGGEMQYFWDSTEMINLSTDSWSFNSSQMVVGVVKEGEQKLWLGGMGNWNACPQTGDMAWRAGPLIWWRPSRAKAVPDMVLGSQVWWKSNFHPPLGPYTFLALRWDSASL